MFALIVVSAFLGVTLAKVPPLPFPMLDGRIVGGVDTTIEEHPYQLSLVFNERHRCGASLIRPNVALTAAHCTVGLQASSLRIRAGSTIKNSGGELADVLNICDHPDYNPYDYDVSVLLLNRSLPIGAGIQTIALQPIGEEVRDGEIATVTGWGALSSGGSSPSILQEVQVPKVSETTCNTRYLGRITDRMHCYGYTKGGQDSCQGDSGGPLVVDGKQVGIVSWGTGCATRIWPGVYSKVANKDISDHIDSCIANF